MDVRNRRAQLRVNQPDAISDIDALASIQSQYAASPRIVSLLVQKAALLDPGKDLMLWYMRIFNVLTAEGIGLDIWGRIVGAVRALSMEQKPFGFTPSRLQPFGQAHFWAGQSKYAVEDMADGMFRDLILWKAAANIGSAEAAVLNSLLARLFPGETAYVLEVGVMHVRVVSEFKLTESQRALVRRYGLFGKGAGVGIEWLESPKPCLGFSGSGLSPFDQGPFFSGRIVTCKPA